MKLTGYYTEAGEKIAAGLLAGETLTVSRIAAGSGSTPLSAAALEQEQQELGLCQPQVEGTSAVLRCTLSSQQAGNPYQLTELGVYALGSGGSPVLYLIFRLDEPMSVDPAARLVLRFNLEQTLSDGSGVEVTAPLNGLVTQEQLDGKADLVYGQLPYAQTPHLTSNVNLYVDASTGDDSNTGTQQAPFKTIQAAVDSLPKDLGVYMAKILIAAGTYDESVFIQGFRAGTTDYSLILQPSGEGAVLVRQIVIKCCTNAVDLSDLQLYGTEGPVLFIVNATALLYNLTVSPQGSSSGGNSDYLILIGINSFVLSRNLVIDGKTTWSGMQVVSGSNFNGDLITIQNCRVGLCLGSSSSHNSAIVQMYDPPTYIGNTVNVQKNGSGNIAINVEGAV